MLGDHTKNQLAIGVASEIQCLEAPGAIHQMVK
jgi:hypothetical protein